MLSATVVSPFAVASPKQLWSELERWHLAGHEDDKLGLCKVLLWSAIVYNQERLRQSGKNENFTLKTKNIPARLQVECFLTFFMRCSSKPALSLQSPPATVGIKTGLMPDSRNCLISTGFHPPSGILAPSKFSCTQASSCLNSLRDSFKAPPTPWWFS